MSLEESALKAALDLAIGRIVDLMKAGRNLAMRSIARRRLRTALGNLLLESTDMRAVRRAIRDAEKYGFDGEELDDVRERLAKVEAFAASTRGKAPPSAKVKRKPAKKKPAARSVARARRRR